MKCFKMTVKLYRNKTNLQAKKVLDLKVSKGGDAKRLLVCREKGAQPSQNLGEDGARRHLIIHLHKPTSIGS